MSNRRKLRRGGLPAVAALDRIVGHQVMGGCGDCDADTRFTRDDLGVYVARVHHDDTCPTWAAIRRARHQHRRNP